MKTQPEGCINQINAMNLNYTKTQFSLSVKVFFVKMYLLIKAILTNFHKKISEKSFIQFRELTFSKLSESPTKVQENQGFDIRALSRFYSQIGGKDTEQDYAINSLSKLAFTLLFSISLAFNAAATDRFVKVGGSGTQSGVDWDNAMSSIATAITAANAASPALNNVYVGAGVYSLTAQMTIPNVNVNIQGGFPSTATGTNVSGYNPTTNATTINGNGFGIFEAGISGIGYSNDLIIKGFTLTEGVATSGSVFYEASSTSATCSYLFEDLKCINNFATNGAFFFTTVNGPTVDFKNCEFNNCDSFNGGAIHITTAPSTTFTIDGCSFSNCDAENGGAIYNTTGPTNYKMLIKNSSFCNNHSSLYGGAIYTTTAPVKIMNCNFTNNSCKVDFWGGAIFATTSSVDCTNSTFYGNHADLGGAVYQTTSQAALASHYDNCKFAYNYNMDPGRSIGAADGGGALHIEGGVNFTVDGSAFYRNSVPGGTFGGAILASGAAICTSMNGSTFLENRIGTSTTINGADFISYNGTNRFQSIQNSKVQLTSSAAYLNQAGTPTGGYTFGTGNTFSNTTDDGGAAALTTTLCPVSVLSFGSAPTAVNSGVGVVDCAKTQISPAPVLGTASQVDLIVTITVTTAGTFTPITLSGSGMTLANGVTSITATTTGIQIFHIPIKYDGTALGTLNFQIGTLTACSANLALAPKSVISNIWTLDNCTPAQVSPALK